MRATLNFGTEVAANAGRQAVIAVEDTRNIITELITPIYVFGLVGPLIFGWVGELALRFWHARWTEVLGFDPGLDHLGHIPATIAFLFVNFYAWIVVGRIESIDLLIHIMPKWIAKRVAEWSTHTDPGKQYSKMLWFVAMFGLWGPALLWVPIELPVWRYPYHYLALLCGTMSITFFVGTIKNWNVLFWRYLLGANVTVFIVRHVLGTVGISIPVMLGFASSQNATDNEAAPWYLLPMALIGLVVVIKKMK